MNTEEKLINFVTNGSNRSLRRVLEKNEMTLKERTPFHRTLLEIAVKNRDVEVLKVLFEFGIFTGGVFFGQGKIGPLFTKAMYEKDTELMNIMSAYPHTLNDTTTIDTEPAPLVYALENKLIKLAERLIKFGANVNISSDKYKKEYFLFIVLCS